MKVIATFVLINLIIVSANIVAATVVLILAPLAKALVPEADSLWWPWAIIMCIGTAFSLNVMKSATEVL